MKITIESTGDFITVDGRPVRHWKGLTEGGVPCDVMVAAIAVPKDQPADEFAELNPSKPPVLGPMSLAPSMN